MNSYEVGDVKILDLKLLNKNTQGSVNPSDQITFIDIYEDFNSPSLYAEITFSDNINLLNDFPIIGEEELQITFQTPGLTYPTTYKLNSFSVSNVQQSENSKGFQYVVKFTSKEQLVQGNINILQSYNENINEIVKNIFNRYLATDKVVSIDPCKGNEPITFPKLTPFSAIDMLRQRAVHPKYLSSSFVFYENQDGFNFKCIEQLIEDGKPNIASKKFYYFSAGKSNPNSEALMFRNIIEFENVFRADITDLIQEGGLKNRVRSFDLFTKNVGDVEFDASKKFNSFVNLDKKNTLGVSDNLVKDFASKPTFNFFIPKDTNRKDNFLDNMMGARLSFLKMFNSNVVRIYVPGDSSLKVGDVIELNLPKSSGTTKKPEGEELVGGNYVISRLRHNITTTGKTKHYVSMDCNKVGYK